MAYKQIYCHLCADALKQIKSVLAIKFAVYLTGLLSTHVAIGQELTLVISAASVEDRPGIWRKVTKADLPKPFASVPAAQNTIIVQRSTNMLPKTLEEFHVELFASNLLGPRTIRVAPNGDIFVAESEAGRLRVFPAGDQTQQKIQNKIYIQGLERPYGIAFYPPGPDPRFLYVALETKVIRFPYLNGDLEAPGSPEVIIKDLPSGGHWTRDIVFSADGKILFLSIGSESNVAEGASILSRGKISELEHMEGSGASWGRERGRAAILAFDPDGKNKRTYATGLRNCTGMALRPNSEELWCVVNERDMLGDNLPPDYATNVRAGTFYGWPWFYIGSNEDPRHVNERTDLARQVIVPDLLFQAHSAPLSISFYQGNLFPKEYWNDAFVALHGSWNRATKTGYKIVRLKFMDGHPTGEYQDFLTGFVLDNTHVWGRPAGVAVTKDGSLLVSDDASGSIWRVVYGKI